MKIRYRYSYESRSWVLKNDMSLYFATYGPGVMKMIEEVYRDNGWL